MTQLEIFQERILACRQRNGCEPAYITMNQLEYEQLREEISSYDDVSIPVSEHKAFRESQLFDDQVATLLGVPVRVPLVEMVEESKGFKMNYQQNNSKFEELARPLMKYLAENHHPHTTVILDATEAEVVEGVEAFTTEEYLVD